MSAKTMQRLFTFPDPVDDVSARLVAAGVVAMAGTAVVADVPWLTLPLAYGFVARAAAGPTLSPLGQLVTRVVRPRLTVAPRRVPGPPKRFAQAIGAVFTVSTAPTDSTSLASCSARCWCPQPSRRSPASAWGASRSVN